jgi:hypothetical protein
VAFLFTCARVDGALGFTTLEVASIEAVKTWQSMRQLRGPVFNRRSPSQQCPRERNRQRRVRDGRSKAKQRRERRVKRRSRQFLARTYGRRFGGQSTLYKYVRSQSPDKNQKAKKDTRLSGMSRKTCASFCMLDKSGHGTSPE